MRHLCLQDPRQLFLPPPPPLPPLLLLLLLLRLLLLLLPLLLLLLQPLQTGVEQRLEVRNACGRHAQEARLVRAGSM